MKKLLTLSLLSCAATSYAALDYAVTGVENQLVGSSAVVLGAGDPPTNFSGLAAVGQFAVFNVSDGASFNGQLRVTYASDLSGTVGSNIMIAQTVNSQNLTDSGTFSVFIQTSSTGINNGVRLQLDWFQAGTYSGTSVVGSLSNTIAPVVNFTTFDIDFEQFVRVERTALSAYQLHSTTELAVTDNGTTVQFNDPSPSASTTVTNPITAAEFTTVAASSYYIEVGTTLPGTNVTSLFMFEMRDPSSNVTVDGPPVVIPEPSALAGLMGLVSLAAVSRRRRVKA